MAGKKVNVKKGDRVIVLTGKDRGRKGKVLSVHPDEGRVVVEGINMIKRHTRPTQKVMQGGIIDKEAPLHISNVMVLCPKCKEPTRVGRMPLADGRRVRFCKNCNEVIDR